MKTPSGRGRRPVDNSRLSRRINDLRDGVGMTFKDIGKALGISQSQAGILYSGTKVKIARPVNVRVERKPNLVMKFGSFERPPVDLDLAMMKFKHKKEK